MDERLWAGWRMKYIESAKTRSCLFCEKSRVRPGPKHLVLHVTQRSLMMLNAFPYNCGHLMVAPRRHVATFSGLTRAESLDLVRLLSMCEELLKRVYRAEGLNVGVNLGKCAGAGVVGHLHVHVVPRWTGDTNCMSTVFGTKVLPEALDVTFGKLMVALEKAGVSRDKRGRGKRRGSKEK